VVDLGRVAAVLHSRAAKSLDQVERQQVIGFGEALDRIDALPAADSLDGELEGESAISECISGLGRLGAVGDPAEEPLSMSTV
jgi:hypothetical protein